MIRAGLRRNRRPQRQAASAAPTRSVSSAGHGRLGRSPAAPPAATLVGATNASGSRRRATGAAARSCAGASTGASFRTRGGAKSSMSVGRGSRAALRTPSMVPPAGATRRANGTTCGDGEVSAENVTVLAGSATGPGRSGAEAVGAALRSKAGVGVDPDGGGGGTSAGGMVTGPGGVAGAGSTPGADDGGRPGDDPGSGGRNVCGSRYPRGSAAIRMPSWT